MWGYFSVQKIDGCNKFAQCGICDRILRFTTSVTNLRKHLERRHPTSLSAARRSSTAGSSAISSGGCENFDRVNGQVNEDHVYSSTHVVDYQSHEPVEYSSKIESPKGTTNESDASTSMFVVTNNGMMHSMSPSSTVLSSVGTKRKWQQSKNFDALTVHHEQASSPKKENDEFDLFGMSIAAKMRKISTTNNVQCIIAEKLISEVIFHGQMQSLTCDTVIKVPEKDN